jgi:hypothetical protein
VFDRFVREHIKAEMPDWDNSYNEMVVKGSDEDPIKSFEDCREACTKDKTCMQYNYREKECKLGDTLRKGVAQEIVKSGYMMERIEQFRKRNQKCTPQWIVEYPHWRTL